MEARIVRPFSAPVARLRGRDRVLAQRAAASLALMASCEASGAPLALERDESGKPLETNGWFHSRAHTVGLAVAAVAREPIGIDVESLDRRRLGAVRTKYADELARLGDDSVATCLGLWCAKEALVKRSGIGVADLPKVRFEAREGVVWQFRYSGALERVLVRIHGSHVVAIAAGALDVHAVRDVNGDQTSKPSTHELEVNA